MTSYGYIRTSTRDQNADLQRDAMTAAGITKVYADEGVSVFGERERTPRYWHGR